MSSYRSMNTCSAVSGLLILLAITMSFTQAALGASFVFSKIDFPVAFGTYAYAINNSGDIVGYYVDGKGTHGFLEVGGTFTTIDFPGASTTFAYGINERNIIVGTYRDAAGIDHGFVASPIPEPSTLTLLGTGIFGLIGYRRKRRKA